MFHDMNESHVSGYGLLICIYEYCTLLPDPTLDRDASNWKLTFDSLEYFCQEIR